MLNDPIYLGLTPSTGSPANTANNEVSSIAIFRTLAQGAGSTKRKAAGLLNMFSSYKGDGIDVLDDLSLLIDNTVTKENAPFQTNRTRIRLDLTRQDVEGSEKSATLSAYIVLAVPTAPMFTQADALILSRTLALFALYGPSTSSTDYSGTTSDATLARLLSGEP